MRAHTSSRFSRLGVAAALLALVVAGARPATAASDPMESQQWNLAQIHAQTAWSVSTGDNVLVGIVDSGVSANHEDLAGQVADAVTCIGTNGSSSGCTPGGDDIDGHGTHVSGIVAAISGNGKGVAGVAPSAKIAMARVFSAPSNAGAAPTAELSDVRAAIRYLAGTLHAKVVNLSIGADRQALQACAALTGCDSPLKDVVEEAWDLGALPVIASGNSQLYGSKGYGNLDAIVVGATTESNAVAPYSTATGNAKWAMVAPGGEIPANQAEPTAAEKARMVLSTYGGPGCNPPSASDCYAGLSGTSMAAPHVSAVAAMLFARGLDRQAVVDTLLSTTEPVPGCSQTRCGAGRVDAAKALGAIEKTTEPTSGGNRTTTSRAGNSKSSTTAARRTGGAAGTTSTTSFGFANADSNNTTPTSRFPRDAIVLNQQPAAENDVPLRVALFGIVCLAGAALALSYSLRRTLTTLP
ncbi:MAG: serine protease [Actinomycetota bacterium]|jgi:subtilisin family serine protease